MPRHFRYCRPKSAPPETICGYLATKFTYFSCEQWREQIHAGYISVNQKQLLDADVELHQQDLISYSPPSSREPEVDTTHIEILHEDEHVLVCCKNGNIPVTEGGRYCEHTLTHFLQQQGQKRAVDKVMSPSPSCAPAPPPDDPALLHSTHYSSSFCSSSLPAGGRLTALSPSPSLSPSAITTTTNTRSTALTTDGGGPHGDNAAAGLSSCHQSSPEAIPVNASANRSIETTAPQWGFTLEEKKEEKRVEKEVSSFREQMQDSPSRKRAHSPMADHSSPSTCAPVRSPSTSCFGNIFPVHRLDKETSGVLIFGKSLEVTRELGGTFEEQSTRLTHAVEKAIDQVEHLSDYENFSTSPSHPPNTFTFSSVFFDDLSHSVGEKNIEKTYIAVLSGIAKENEVHVVVTRIGSMANDPEWRKNHSGHEKLKKIKMLCYSLPTTSQHLDKSLDEKSTRATTTVSSSFSSSAPMAPTSRTRGKIAVSRISIMAVNKRYHFSVAKIDILTGRTHQIRLHCAHIGYPVLGDKLYHTRTPGVRGGEFAVEDAVYLSRVQSPPSTTATTAIMSGEYLKEERILATGCRRHLLHAARLMVAVPRSWATRLTEWHAAASPPPPSSPFPSPSSASLSEMWSCGSSKEKEVMELEAVGGAVVNKLDYHLQSPLAQQQQEQGEREKKRPLLSPPLHKTYTFLSNPSYWFLLDIMVDDAEAAEALQSCVYQAFKKSFFSQGEKQQYKQ